MMEQLKRYWEIAKLALLQEKAAKDSKIKGMNEHEKEFLPAVLEVTEMPPSHAARLLTYVIILMYRFSKKIIPTCIAEALGTGILGGLAAYPLAKYVMLIQPEGMFIYIVPFLISTVAGSIVAAIVMLILKKNGALTVFKENLE